MYLKLNLQIMSNNLKYTLTQKGIEVQEILNRDVFLSEEEYELLKLEGKLDDKKVYFIYEEE